MTSPSRLFTYVCCLAVGLVGLARADESTKASSIVEIIRQNDGHIGAGVQIEPGLILTAAHVVREEQQVTVRDDRGRVQSGRVREINFNVDYALISIGSPSYLQVSALFCRTPPVGLPIEMIGHPFGKTFITMRARVWTDVRSVGQWPSVIFLTREAFPGMSGGPVFAHRQGRPVLVAMVVADAFDPKLRRYFAGAVPASVICSLMAARSPSPY